MEDIDTDMDTDTDTDTVTDTDTSTNTDTDTETGTDTNTTNNEKISAGIPLKSRPAACPGMLDVLPDSCFFPLGMNCAICRHRI